MKTLQVCSMTKFVKYFLSILMIGSQKFIKYRFTAPKLTFGIFFFYVPSRCWRSSLSAIHRPFYLFVNFVFLLSLLNQVQTWSSSLVLLPPSVLLAFSLSSVYPISKPLFPHYMSYTRQLTLSDVPYTVR